MKAGVKTHSVHTTIAGRPAKTCPSLQSNHHWTQNMEALAKSEDVRRDANTFILHFLLQRLESQQPGLMQGMIEGILGGPNCDARVLCTGLLSPGKLETKRFESSISQMTR